MEKSIAVPYGELGLNPQAFILVTCRVQMGFVKPPSLRCWPRSG